MFISLLIFGKFVVINTKVISNYATNLTDKQWQVIKKIVKTKEKETKTFFR